ncbi:VOC family protein [Mesorhizobium sp. CGMCC 1.15528]|uniref:VOC family protein n=1 Tax=Mesorhizobium zhangyense TaxID=1776730 RepID=A0A7C9RBA4_9HYPH|nr:VOC family protein [Mesorhizobium zhangyense]NGN44377.1 VOC family protein [Mesorhizobium zhangyense]
MKSNTYLAFNGTCEAAFKFYEKVLGGKIVMMMPHAGTPAEGYVPAEWRDKIMHARLTFGDDQVLMGSDAPPQYKTKMDGFSISLQFTDKAEAKRVFDALAEKGEVKQPFEKTFWAEGFGMLIDQFGTPWMVNCEAPAA